MAKAHFVKSARTDIYSNGLQVKSDNKSGYKIDRSQPENEKDVIIVKKGESYWWWMFNFNPHKYISKTQPKRSQLTQSSFLSQYYELDDRIHNMSVENYETLGELESDIDDIKSDIENLKDECQSSLEQMPEHLQESSSSGETLQERIDALDDLSSQFDSLNIPSDDDAESNVDEDEINKITDLEGLKEIIEKNNLTLSVECNTSVINIFENNLQTHIVASKQNPTEYCIKISDCNNLEIIERFDMSQVTSAFEELRKILISFLKKIEVKKEIESCIDEVNSIECSL